MSLFLDIPLDGDGTAWITGDHTFAFIADSTYPDYGKWWRHGDESGHQEEPAPPETRLALRLGERGNYTLEAAIPMGVLMESSLDWRPPFAGRTVGFMFLVTDPDGGPSPGGGQLAYGGHNDDDADWAKLRFRPTEMAVPPHYELPDDLDTVADRVPVGAISGQVTTEKGEKPYPGLLIEAYREDQPAGSAQTDAEGRYHLVVLPGEYTLKPGDGQGVEPFAVGGLRVRAGEETPADLVLVPPGVISGRVTTEGKRSPMLA